MSKSLPCRSLIWIAFAGLMITPFPAHAGGKQPPPKISFQYRDEAIKAKAGATPTAPEVLVHVELPAGWHINSQSPLDSFLVPTSVAVEAQGVAFADPIYPKADVQQSAVMGGPISLFTGAFDIRVPLAAKGSAYPSGAPPRTRVTLRFQSCNNEMCLPPASVSVER
jgi:hypothetical protein